MIIADVGEKVHIIERRYFMEDVRRHFAGVIVRSTNTALRVKGHVWVIDARTGQWTRKPELRERVFHTGERLTINIIPPEVDIDELKYLGEPHRGLVLTDGKGYSLDLSEFNVIR